MAALVTINNFGKVSEVAKKSRVLKFDSRRMYIMNMTPKEIKEYNERSKKEFESFHISLFESKEDKWGFFFPLFLFFAGMSVPFFTDRALYMWFALVPFYLYDFTIMGVPSIPEEIKKNASLAMAVTFGVSLILTICWASFMDDSDGPLNSIALMGVFNLVPAFVSYWLGILFKSIHL
ncbi:hypothetical protein [Fibrobacter sp.]|uniref:hypothetical protein n=1 Tax=Fibrobacter sp. TaxID=35828 RepID=UPI00388E368C